MVVLILALILALIRLMEPKTIITTIAPTTNPDLQLVMADTTTMTLKYKPCVVDVEVVAMNQVMTPMKLRIPTPEFVLTRQMDLQTQTEKTACGMN